MSEDEETIPEDEIETEDSASEEAPSPELSEDAATIAQLQLARDTYLSALKQSLITSDAKHKNVRVI